MDDQTIASRALKGKIIFPSADAIRRSAHASAELFSLLDSVSEYLVSCGCLVTRSTVAKAAQQWFHHAFDG
jgi:hypothetical protein